jgi:hypothetical protein
LQNGVNQNGQQPNGAGVTPAPREPATAQVAPEAVDPFTGKGYLLEADDAEAFRVIDAMVKRQEPLAINRLAQDRHFTATKLGYWGSQLIKVENQSQYQQSYLAGTQNRLRTGAVPNKQAELCQKLVETLMVDPPKLDPEPEDDDETAQRGAELAREFLEQDGTESGTDDLTNWASQLEAATCRASAFNHYWIDPSGAGSVPKQIKAHPQAVDAANPLVGPDGMPTTDYVLRYVTEAGQFTVNPSEAERVWLPRIRVSRRYREHVRLYPETADLHDAQQAIVLDYCTVAEAKRRWPETIGPMEDAELVPLVGWSPPRAVVLLPASMRQRWRDGSRDTANGAAKDLKAGAMDQRILFFYCYYGLSEQAYPEGAAICINGAGGGFVLGKDTLSATVSLPSQAMQDEEVTDRKDLDIPLAQLRLLPDVDDGDPMGSHFMRRIAGAGEASATMSTAMAQAIDQVLNPVRYSIGTSSVDIDDVEAARSTGDYIPVGDKDEVPQLEEARDLPAAFFNFNQWVYDQMDASAGLRPPDRASEAKVKSGVALRIEVQEATKTLTRMNYAFHVFAQRHGRIKLQMVMKHYDVSRLIRYTGEDGSAKQEWFTGNNFARVSTVRIATGSGTMLPPLEKVNMAIQLQGAMLMDPDEAHDIARPAFSRQLGVGDNPHVQRIERQVSSWLEGPPEGWEMQQQQFVVAAQQHAALAQQAIEASPDPRAAQIPPPPQAPWTPFDVLPWDSEPPIAALRKRRLAALGSKVEFSKQPPFWRQVVVDAYNAAVGALQAAQAVAQPQQAGATEEMSISENAGP